MWPANRRLPERLDPDDVILHYSHNNTQFVLKEKHKFSTNLTGESGGV